VFFGFYDGIARVLRLPLITGIPCSRVDLLHRREGLFQLLEGLLVHAAVWCIDRHAGIPQQTSQVTLRDGRKLLEQVLPVRRRDGRESFFPQVFGEERFFRSLAGGWHGGIGR